MMFLLEEVSGGRRADHLVIEAKEDRMWLSSTEASRENGSFIITISVGYVGWLRFIMEFDMVVSQPDHACSRRSRSRRRCLFMFH